MNTRTDWGKLQTLQKTFKRGTELITQGAKPKALYVLISGRLNVFRDGISVSQIKKRGEYIGEIAVLLKIPASATVKAETDIVVIEIEYSKVIPFFHHTPEIAIALARKMAERLVELNANFSQLVDKSYRPDLIKSLQDKQRTPESQNTEELNLQKLKSFFVEYAEGMDILVQGQYPGALYILVNGSLEIVKNGKVIAIEDKPGYYLGDVAILRNTFSNATVVTRTTSTLIEIKIDKVEAFLNHSPEIAISIAVKLAERTLAINELFLDLQADAISEIKKKQEQMKKDEIRRELAERKKNMQEKERLNSLEKNQSESLKKKQDSISHEIEELKKVEKDIYKLLGLEIEDY